MADEAVLVRISVQNDARLLAGVAAVAGCCSLSAGLAEEESAALRETVRAACEYSFGEESTGALEIDFRRSSNRLDVTICRPVAAGYEAAPLPALGGVEQARQEVRGDRACLVLTKTIKPPVQAG